MPAVGVPNNPSGANSFDHFAPEPAYGEATKQASLQRGAPMAGAAVASRPIAAPKRAGRQAQRGITPAPAAAPPTAPAPVQTPSYDARLAQYWQGIAAIPGASPLVKEYAAIAIQRLTGGPYEAAWGPHAGSGAVVGGKAGQGQSGLPPVKPAKLKA